MTQNCINTTSPVLQIVSANASSLITLSTALPWDNTIPQNTEGTEIITVTITPKSATSLLEINFNGILQRGTAITAISWALFQDSTAGALAAKGVIYQVRPHPSMIHYMTSGTTSSTTFKIRAGPVSGTGYNNGSGATRTYGGIAGTNIKIVEYLQ